MGKENVFNKVEEVHEKIKEGGSGLVDILKKSALSLADTFNSAFPVDEDIVKTYGAIIDGLNIKQRRDKLESEIKDKDGTLIKKLSDLDNERDEKKQKADKININNRNAPNWDSDSREKSKLNSQIERIEEEIRKVKDDIKEKKKEYDALAIFVDDGRDSGYVVKRKQEIESIKAAAEFFDLKNFIDHQSLDIGKSGKTIDLKNKFKGKVKTFEYAFYDDKTGKKIRLDEPLTVSAVTSSGNPIEVTLKGIKIDPSTQQLTITDLKVEGDVADAPLIIRDLYVRATHQDKSGPMFYHDKKLSLNINNPVATFDLSVAYDNVRSAIDTQLDHTYDRNYNKIKQEVIFKTLEENNKVQFEKLSDKQKETFINGLVITGYSIPDKNSFKTLYKDFVINKGFKGTESQFVSQLLENIDKKSEEGLQKMLEDRLDTTNIGTKPAKASIIEDFITYFASTDIVKNQARRQAQYDAINLRSGNHVNTLLAHTHATKYADARKEVLFKLLGEEIAKDQFAKFTDDQKKTLLTRLVALTAGGYDMDAATFQTSFRTEIAKEDFSGTEDEFEKQLLTNFDVKAEEKLKKILTDRLDSASIGGNKAKAAIVGEFMNYLTTVNIVKDQARRETLYNAVDVRTGGEITRKLAHTHATKYADARKEVLFKLLGEEIDKDQFAKLTDDQKKTLLTRLVALTAGGYDMDVPTFQTSFRTEIAKEDFTGTEDEFEKKLITNFDGKATEQLKKILEKRLDSATIGGNKARSVLAGEFMNYLTSVNITKDSARRETLYNAVDVRTGGQITRQLANVHATKYKDTKKQVLLKFMEETVGKEAFDKLSDKQKDACLASLVTTGYDMDVPTFQTSFRTEIAKEDFTGTEDEFEKKLITNLDGKAAEQLQKILEKRLDSATIGGNKARSVLAGRFLDYVNNSAFDVPKRHAAFQVLEGNLTAELLQTRLRQEFELKFNKLQREAFEKTLALNPEFGKLNQAQKDRIYERMQELGTINAGAVDVKLGDLPTIPASPLTYSISDITFAPTLHQYSLMPSDEDYAGFSTWLVNQLPTDVGSDPDKYKDWMRNGLVASLDNGKTHYENFFADVLKKFTDNINVKTTLNQTLLDFINDTNTADHMAFDADLLANLTSTTPLTDHPKKRYQKLMPWVKGEPQNYLSFFQGQSQEFKTESITVGGKTISYSGKLEIGGAENVSMSLKMKDEQEKIYKSGSPVALVRALLTSPDIEPPHARFHAGLSVIKSVTKLARANGISLRTALTPEMLDTLPISIRATVGAGENPMVEIQENDKGKLVATVFNLNLTTRRKENIHTMFDEEAFVATQSVRDLRQGVESLLALTNQTLNNTYVNYREASRGSGLRRALLKKNRYGGLMNFWKTISFEGQNISVGGKNIMLTCKDGLFTFSGEGLEKPISGKNLGKLLTFNPALRGIELKALHIANENMLETYQDKLAKKDRMKNYGVIDELNHRVYILDKDGNLGYVENTSQEFASRWRQYSSGHSYGRIKDGDMPVGFRVMKKGKTVVDKESYENFLRNESLVGPMVRAMSRTHRAVTTWAPWD